MDDGWTNLKGRFPFRLGTTSYILPAPILPNVRYLAPLVDEIELVLFESRAAGNLPDAADILEMARLGAEREVRYNVHLPTDIRLGDPDAATRRAARATLSRFYHRTLPLDPTAYVLHLEGPPTAAEGRDALTAWTDRTLDSLEALFRDGMDRRRLAVENLESPFASVAPIVSALDLGLCLDAGHLLKQSIPLETLFGPNRPRTVMVHLHGVVDGRDHRSLAGVPDEAWSFVSDWLKTYRGGVSLEVFSRDDLRTSLVRMAELA